MCLFSYGFLLVIQSINFASLRSSINAEVQVHHFVSAHEIQQSLARAKRCASAGVILVRYRFTFLSVSLAPVLLYFLDATILSHALSSCSSARIAELAQLTLFVLLLYWLIHLLCVFPHNSVTSKPEFETATASRITSRATNGYKNVAYFVNWYVLNSHVPSQWVGHTHHTTGPSTAATSSPRTSPPTS